METVIMNPNLEKITNTYFEKNAVKLHRMVDKIIRKLNFQNVDIDEYYSLSHEIFYNCLANYDETKDFNGFLYSCLYKKFCTNMTKLNRDKRCNNIKVQKKDENGDIILERIKIPDKSIDEPLTDNENLSLKEMIPSDFDMEFDYFKDILSENMERYIDSLNETQKKIAKMIGDGKTPDEIQQQLGLTQKEYASQYNEMCLYEKRMIFYQNENTNNDMEDDNMSETTILIDNTTETYKNTSYSIDSISKQLHKKRIRDDHILQRHSGQWKSFAKSELISDILRGKSLTQIIISEEIKNGLRMQWLIDGKQRCTTLDDYIHNGFAISKNIKNYNIQYQANKLDEDGNEVLNEEGFTVLETKVFDIRNKKFSQLPEELQDIFKDRQIPVLYNMNCTKKDIAEDIARFNRSRPMNKSQNGWLGLDEDFAELAEKITTMPFFQTDFVGSTYTNNNRTSGNMRRIVVESIMVSDFLDDYCKDFEKMCEYLSEEASDSNFTEFYSLVDRLTSVCDKDVASLFNAKDSFLWFALFSRFVKTGLNDDIFVSFLKEFINNLHTKKINDMSFDDLLIESKSTKDKSIVVKKINHLEELMDEFIHNYNNTEEDLKDIDTYEFIKENVDQETTKEDVEQYEEVLDDLTLNVDNSSRLLEPHSRPSLVAMVAYSFKNDLELDDWIIDYFKKNNNYILNVKNNFLHMKNDFENYINRNKEAIA